MATDRRQPLTTEYAPAASSILDTQGALRRLMGKQHIYRKVVESYLREAPALLASLPASWPQEDCAAHQRVAHTVKGLAATVGANATAAAADQLETALRDGEANAYTDCLALLQACVETARLPLQHFLSAAQNTDEPEAPQHSNASLNLALAQLVPLLRQSNVGAITLCEQLRARHGDSYRDEFAALSAAVERMDFDAALAICQTLQANEEECSPCHNK